MAGVLRSPASFYPWTLISYSYGKILLAPGQRIGYLAISPRMPFKERKALSNVMFSTQMALGWCFPNAIMQYAVPDLESLSIDLTALRRRRDVLAATLTNAGYDVLSPDGTFYLWTKWPEGNPQVPLEQTCRSQRLCAARQHHECYGLFSHQPYRIRRNDRACTASFFGSNLEPRS